jgi:beta-lactamase class A
VKRSRFIALGAGYLAVPSETEAEGYRETLIWYGARLNRHEPPVSHNADQVLPAASIIKLLIVRTILTEIARGRLALNASVEITPGDRVGGSDRYGSARAGRYQIAPLLKAMISFSDNTAANALLHKVGFQRCNEQATSLGLKYTRIRRSFYDWDAQRRGLENTTTPRESALMLADLAALTRASDKVRAGAQLAMDALLTQTDRETIPTALLRRFAIANKTGELPGIRNDVAIVDYGHPEAYVVSVMSRYVGIARAVAIRDVRSVVINVDRHFAFGNGV